MKFLTRSIVALFLTAVTVGLLMLAVGQVTWALREAQSNERPSRPQRERVFAVDLATFAPDTVSPQITAFGRVESWRSTELRAVVAGALVDLSPDFRDGGRIASGQMVFQIDPAKFQSSLALAETELREAEAELDDATAAIDLAGTDLALAQKQLSLRAQALSRQEDLQRRGIGTDAGVETAALSVATAEQAIVNQQRALAQAEARVLRAGIALDRRRISVGEAERLLSETTVLAPFDGVVSNVTAIQGRMVSANEKLGDLIDPKALEVAFRVSGTQYARLLDATGQLRPLSVAVQFDIEDLPFEISGTIDREEAEVGEGQTGRLIYARLAGSGVAILRPGDFLSVAITEPLLENVAVVPATAVTNSGNMLVLGDDNRLEEITVNIVRQQSDSLIVDDVPFGREFVTALGPQIGQGIQVKPIRWSEGQEDRAAEAAVSTTPEMIILDTDRKARLLAFVDSNQRMPADAKARILAQLSEPEVPKAVVDRLERRMDR